MPWISVVWIHSYSKLNKLISLSVHGKVNFSMASAFQKTFSKASITTAYLHRFCPAITMVWDAVKTNFSKICHFFLVSLGDILEGSFLIRVKPDGELFWNFPASQFTVVTLIANAGIMAIMHLLECG